VEYKDGRASVFATLGALDYMPHFFVGQRMTCGCLAKGNMPTGK